MKNLIESIYNALKYKIDLHNTLTLSISFNMLFILVKYLQLKLIIYNIIT